jgi:dihydroorotate dehydrogenase electron transfer subunit
MEGASTARFIETAEVLRNDEVAPQQFRMRLRSPNIAQASIAGQFCMMSVAEGLDPFLRRPMCFERLHPDGFDVLYKIEGRGTQLMAEMEAGRSISIQGPLGNGWPLDAAFKRHVIVGGGIGVAPFPGLAEALKEHLDVAPEVVLAARSKHLLFCEDDFRQMDCTVHVATDDGSAGEQAFAAQMLERIAPGPDTRVYVCGPMIMMKTCSQVALDAGASCLVSLEAQMACGDGVCLGCVVESKHEIEGEKMVRVCYDGPVFDTTDIDWKAHDLAYDV